MTSTNSELTRTIESLRATLVREREDRELEVLQWQDNFKTVVKEAQMIARSAGEVVERDCGKGGVLGEGGEVRRRLDGAATVWEN